jgi:hypothetical protein
MEMVGQICNESPFSLIVKIRLFHGTPGSSDRLVNAAGPVASQFACRCLFVFAQLALLQVRVSFVTLILQDQCFPTIENYHPVAVSDSRFLHLYLSHLADLVI